MSRLLLIVFATLFLFGCSDKNNKYKAWNETYWGMPEDELIKLISADSQSAQINKSECNKNHAEKAKLNSCSFVSLKNYSSCGGRKTIIPNFNDVTLGE